MTEEEHLSSDTILVAIDGSLQSEIAAIAAVQIASKQNLNITGLYVVGARLVMLDNNASKTELGLEAKPVARDELVKQFQSQGDEALDWLEEHSSMSGVPAKTDIFFGGIPEIVLEKARWAKILALGRRGHTHLNTPYELGENFRHIASHCHIPILIGGEEKTNFQRFLIVLDGNVDIKNILTWASLLQKAFSSEVLVATYQENETHRDQTSMILGQLNRSTLVEYQQVSGPIRSGSEIVIAAEDHHVDLIIMEGYRRAALGFWLEKHPLEDVLRNVVPQNKKLLS